MKSGTFLVHRSGERWTSASREMASGTSPGEWSLHSLSSCLCGGSLKHALMHHGQQEGGALQSGFERDSVPISGMESRNAVL